MRSPTHPGSSVGAPAAEIGIVANTASTLVNHLAAAGLVRRDGDPDDRRSSRVRLTPAAGERMGAWRERRLEVLEEALAPLERPELERLAAALPALRRLQRALDGELGPDGAGKTTTLRVLTTLLPAASGRVSVLRFDVRLQAMAVRRLLALVAQQLSADAALTGREKVAIFAPLFDVPRRQRRHVVEGALELMAIADVADRLAGTDSGGMLRRLELAQALVNRPRLLAALLPRLARSARRCAMMARGAAWAAPRRRAT